MGKATLGTIPFVLVGGHIAGASGVLIGQAVGSVVFGIIGFSLVIHQVKKMGLAHEKQQLDSHEILTPSVPVAPFCSSRTYMGTEDVLEETLAVEIEHHHDSSVLKREK